MALGLVAAALCSVLTGCVFTPSTFNAVDADDELVMWSYVGTDEPSMVALNKKFERQNPGVQVKVVNIPLSEFGPKLVAAAGTKAGPDVIIGNPVADFDLLAGADVYADLSEQLDNSALRENLQDEAIWTDGSEVLALQWRFNNLGFWYNKSILNKHGIEPPDTVQELEKAMTKVIRESENFGMAMAGAPQVPTAWQAIHWMLGYGANYCNIESSGTVKAMKMVDRWQENGLLAPHVTTLDQNQAFDAFATGNYAFAIGGSWEMASLEQSPLKFDVGTSLIPAGPQGSYSTFAGESIGIGRFADNPDLAWELIKTYLQPSSQLTTFEMVGALPPSPKVRSREAVQQVELSEPFVTAMNEDHLKPWPENSRTLEAQTAVGTIYSSMLADAFPPKKAANKMAAAVKTAFEKGTGDC
ncbi:ABC transporter substrate-binding protein [Arthrobacter castelli]|uniref:ABC transporter substrate-binding protein n=1 Tax=Arthrobacter castelli TaxID=271431 RepID=UPI00040FA85D|nr:extracellular solute-binding protein [Arthrobacter castelli]